MRWVMHDDSTVTTMKLKQRQEKSSMVAKTCGVVVQNGKYIIFCIILPRLKLFLARKCKVHCMIKKCKD